VAAFVVRGPDLVLHLNPLEKFGGFHGDIRVPLTAVRSVSISRYAWSELRGWRMAGIGIPGFIAFGTWKHGNGYDFCAVRKARAGVRVDVVHGRFSRLTVSVPEGTDPQVEADRIADAAGIARPEPLADGGGDP
jgi:uncharacterized protein